MKPDFSRSCTDRTRAICSDLKQIQFRYKEEISYDEGGETLDCSEQW